MRILSIIVLNACVTHTNGAYNIGTRIMHVLVHPNAAALAANKIESDSVWTILLQSNGFGFLLPPRSLLDLTFFTATSEHTRNQ